jgi:hypothetical protein
LLGSKKCNKVKGQQGARAQIREPPLIHVQASSLSDLVSGLQFSHRIQFNWRVIIFIFMFAAVNIYITIVIIIIIIIIIIVTDLINA